MKRRWLVFAALAGCSAPAAGADAPDDRGATPRQWSGTVALNATRRDTGETGGAQVVSVTRQAGASYLRATLSRYRGDLRQLDNAVRPTFAVATLGWGKRWSSWFVDTYASLGRQSYGPIAQAGVVRASTGPTTSPYYGAGAAIGRVSRLAPGWYLTASGGLTYSYARVIRPGPLGRGFDRDSPEPATAGYVTLRVDRQFGAERGPLAGAFASLRATSNATSDFGSSFRGGALPSIRPSFIETNRGDGWVETGATLQTSLTRSVTLDGFVSRTIGERAGNATNGGLSLRVAF